MSAAAAVNVKTAEPKVTVILKPSFQLTAGLHGLSVTVHAVLSDRAPVAFKPRGSTH
ncbi:MAG: hypothetical protein K1X64_20250 [Myxococcaceae bacterium]|nr:hypothetical protein [Myxococcaceae bacterium]